MDKEYEYFTKPRQGFLPKTQIAALLGVEQGLIPASHFIQKAVNVKPIFEKPYDFAEFDRILAKKHLSLESVLQLTEVFEELILHPDPEIALYGAESLNSLELRYNTIIQRCKDRLNKGFHAPAVRELVPALYEMGMMNLGRPMLKKFYLGEALGYLEEYWSQLKPITLGDIDLLVTLHLESGTALSGANDPGKNHPEKSLGRPFFSSKPKVLYHVRGIGDLAASLARLDEERGEIEKHTIDFWLGRSTDEED
jgi:hypothetical protein